MIELQTNAARAALMAVFVSCAACEAPSLIPTVANIAIVDGGIDLELWGEYHNPLISTGCRISDKLRFDIDGIDVETPIVHGRTIAHGPLGSGTCVALATIDLSMNPPGPRDLVITSNEPSVPWEIVVVDGIAARTIATETDVLLRGRVAVIEVPVVAELQDVRITIREIDGGVIDVDFDTTPSGFSFVVPETAALDDNAITLSYSRVPRAAGDDIDVEVEPHRAIDVLDVIVR